jgi:sarcosine oxidase subunit beta
MRRPVVKRSIVKGALRMLRKWGGIVDVTPDRSPIVAKTPVPGLYVNCGCHRVGCRRRTGPCPSR